MLKILPRRGKEDKWNVKPFTKAESHFVDARFFEENDAPRESIPSTITSMGRGSMKNVIQLPKEDIPHISSSRKKSNSGHMLFCQVDKYEGRYHYKVDTNSPKGIPKFG